MPLACAPRQMRVWPTIAARLTGHTRRRANGKKRHRFCSRWPATAAAGDAGKLTIVEEVTSEACAANASFLVAINIA